MATKLKPNSVETLPTAPQFTGLQTADSTPSHFAVPRALWVAPLFLVVLTTVFAVFAFLLPSAEPRYTSLLGHLNLTGGLPEVVALRLRPFFLAFFWTFSLFAAGSWSWRFKLLASFSLLFSLLTFLLDILLVNISGLLGFSFTSTLTNLVLGFALLGAFSWALLRQATLPDDALVRAERQRSKRYLTRFVFAAVVAGTVSFAANSLLSWPLELLRNVALLGGLGPGILLFFPVFIAVLAGLTHKARAVADQVRLGTGAGGVPGPAAVVAVPSSYMNESGGPVKALLSFFSIPVERLVVLHDELDIDAGVVRLKRGGGEGGHNGLRSISSSLGTKDYHRVRVGIGRPPGRMDAADYVLRDFSPTERKDVLPFLVDDAADAVEQLVTVGLLDAPAARARPPLTAGGPGVADARNRVTERSRACYLAKATEAGSVVDLFR